MQYSSLDFAASATSFHKLCLDTVTPGGDGRISGKDSEVLTKMFNECQPDIQRAVGPSPILIDPEIEAVESDGGNSDEEEIDLGIDDEDGEEEQEQEMEKEKDAGGVNTEVSKESSTGGEDALGLEAG